MTLESIVSEIFTAAGEPPDLEYRDAALATDTTSANWLQFVRLVNEAQGAVATWVHQDGRRMRMRLAEDTARLTAEIVSDTVVGVTGTVLTLTTPTTGRDTYRGWLIRNATGASAFVFVSYQNGGVETLMLSEVSGTFAAGNAVTLSSRSYQFDDIGAAVPPFGAGTIWCDYAYGAPLEITGVVTTEGTELVLGKQSEPQLVVSANAGQPTTYTKSYLGLRFDTYPDAAYEYIVRFMRLPRPLTVGDSLVEPEIPPQFHRAIVLYALWWLFMRSQETDKAYAVRRNFEDMLKRTQTEYDLQDRTQRGQITLTGEN